MSEFGGLRKHEQIQQALVGLGSAALAAAVALPWVRRTAFPVRDNKMNKKIYAYYENLWCYHSQQAHKFHSQ